MKAAELLIKDPKIAFLDEPTMGLDPTATNRMTELIQNVSGEKKMTVILSSHFCTWPRRYATVLVL